MENLELEKDSFQKELSELSKLFDKVKLFDNYKLVKEFATEVM